jgi:hypothetical protein
MSTANADIIGCNGEVNLVKFLEENSYCPHQTSTEEITMIIQKLIAENDDFSLLKDMDIQLRFYNDDQYFFKTFLKPLHIFFKSEKRTYFIDINEKVFQCSPSPVALEAILAHELYHIKDYAEYKTKNFFSLLWKMAGKKRRSQYERHTDLRTLNAHEKYADGLIEYRKWIYQRLDEKGLIKKKFFYLTPQEIDEIRAGRTPALK